MKSPLVLVADDEAMIALDLEGALVDAGFMVAVATSCAEAIRFLKERRPAAAVLDVRLSDGHSDKVAEMLVDEGVPFVVYTGLDVEAGSSAFAHGRTLLKPTAAEEVVRLIRMIIGTGKDEGQGKSPSAVACGTTAAPREAGNCDRSR